MSGVLGMTTLSSGTREIEMIPRILTVVAALLWAGSTFAADVTLLNCRRTYHSLRHCI
jgi:hypothetical protein